MWAIATALGKGVFNFLTSKVGLICLAIALFAYVEYRIYDAGAESEKASAQKLVTAANADRDKKVAEANATITTLRAEKKQWTEGLNKAVAEAKSAQGTVIEGLRRDLAAAKAKGEKVRTVIKEVPKYVTVQADAGCVVSSGFVWLHDYALQAGPMAGSGPANVDAPSGIALSHVADVDASNAAECVDRGIVIEKWQEWYVKNKAIFDVLQEKAQR